jgi:hypothetical protein
MCSADGEARLLEVDVQQAHITRAAGGDHHVVDRGRQVQEEFLQRSWIIGVEGGSTQRAELARGALQSFATPPGEDHVGAPSACLARRFEPDTRATAYHDDGLPE